MKLFARILFALFFALAGFGVCSAQTSESTFLDRDGKSIKARFIAPTVEINRRQIIELEFNGFWKGDGKPTNTQAEIVWRENERASGRTKFSARRCDGEVEIECYVFLFTLPVARETVENLLESENITINFNRTSFKLTAEEINRLRDFIKSVKK